MADKKISQLTGATTPLAGTEVLPIVQSGSTVKVASDDLTVKNVRSNATTGILQVAGPAAASTRVMTVPDANFTAARTDAAQSFTGTQVISTGNLGLGGSPSAWSNDFGPVIQVKSGSGGGALTGNNADNFRMFANTFYDGSGYKRIDSGYATQYEQAAGRHVWLTAGTSTANSSITFVEGLNLDANRNLLLNGSSAPSSGVGTFAIKNGTAPTGSVTDGCVLYTEDVSSSSELKVRDEAGNVTTLSPHNFSLIPEGASEDMAWAYYSEKNGKRINVDMLKLARMVEKLTGEKLVYEA